MARIRRHSEGVLAWFVWRLSNSSVDLSIFVCYNGHTWRCGMNRKQAEHKLAELGYEIDWSCTGPSEGYWSGTIDATGRGQIDGDCRGEVVTGVNAADWYRNAVEQAKGYSRPTRCTNPDCDFHADHPLTQ